MHQFACAPNRSRTHAPHISMRAIDHGRRKRMQSAKQTHRAQTHVNVASIRPPKALRQTPEDLQQALSLSSSPSPPPPPWDRRRPPTPPTLPPSARRRARARTRAREHDASCILYAYCTHVRDAEAKTPLSKPNVKNHSVAPRGDHLNVEYMKTPTTCTTANARVRARCILYELYTHVHAVRANT